jgi:hypothetical protein
MLSMIGHPQGSSGVFLQAVGEDDLDDRADRILASPVALELAGE